MTKLLLVLGTAALCVTCSNKQPAPTPDPGSPQQGSGWYRAVLGEKQGTSIPFFLQLPASGHEARIATGPDRVSAMMLSGPPHLDLEFGILSTWIDATAKPNGVLEGTWESKSKSLGRASLSFRAEPISGPDPSLRFPSQAGAAAR